MSLSFEGLLEENSLVFSWSTCEDGLGLPSSVWGWGSMWFNIIVAQAHVISMGSHSHGFSWTNPGTTWKDCLQTSHSYIWLVQSNLCRMTRAAWTGHKISSLQAANLAISNSEGCWGKFCTAKVRSCSQPVQTHMIILACMPPDNQQSGLQHWWLLMRCSGAFQQTLLLKMIVVLTYALQLLTCSAPWYQSPWIFHYWLRFEFNFTWVFLESTDLGRIHRFREASKDPSGCFHLFLVLLQ